MILQPAVYDIVIPRGADFALSLRLLDSDDVAVDLTGATVRAQLRAYTGAAAALEDFTCTVDADPTTGEVIISLTDTETTAIPATGRAWSEYLRCAWDLFIDWSDGTVTRAIHGEAKISPQATQVIPPPAGD